MSNLDISIRFATDKDMADIHSWLLDHGRRGIDGSFLCNWSLTENTYNEGKVIVGILNGQPVAYMWCDFGIAEVREDLRGQGIGRKLVEHALTIARENDIACIDIECTPETSIPFWKKLGFKLYSENNAYLLIEKPLPLPTVAEPVDIEISFYPESRKWSSETKAIYSFSPSAVKGKDSLIYLSHRVAIFANSSIWNSDPIVSIKASGYEVYLGKAKHQEASDIGVKYNGGAYAIERITIRSRGGSLQPRP